jgi:glycosyltransferase involved in cell wall biosynthesis
MECGLPIIGYNRGGQNDFLINEKTGFSVELGDKNSFAESVVKLMTNTMLKEKTSSYNRKLVKNFYISTCAEKYISLFEKVISDNRVQAKGTSQ